MSLLFLTGLATCCASTVVPTTPPRTDDNNPAFDTPPDELAGSRDEIEARGWGWSVVGHKH
jgi:hypothetical protein